MSEYYKPFIVIDGVIYDSKGTEVRLWGTNYYLPFNNNYVNIEEMGIDHLKAIDRDICDFKHMGIDVIRMHAYEREITDICGNIVENEHLRVMDYLIEKLDEAGIYVMMTPIVWYNTVVNQRCITQNYAYWSAEKSKAFGYANFYPNHAMVWHEKALECQENYLRQFFGRKNIFSGKRLDEYDNVVVIEVSNETIYPTPELICNLREQQNDNLVNSYKDDEFKIIDMYEKFIAKKGINDSTENMQLFCANLLKKYLNRMYGIVNEYFGDTVLKSHIFYQFEKPCIYQCLSEADINCISVSGYAPNHFDTSYNDHSNYLSDIRNFKNMYEGLKPLRYGLIAYEYDAPTTLLGHPYGAFGYAFAAMGVQIAIHFTYTPLDVAAYNPGWIVHYMNLQHTPEKAVAFIAGGEIFRNTPIGADIPESDKLWKDTYYEIDAEHKKVVFDGGDVLIHCGDYMKKTNSIPSVISGLGSNLFVEHSGNGVYFLEEISDSEFSLEVMPNQWYVNDPFRGKSFRHMANRYVDTNRECIVSRLRENGTDLKFNYPNFENYSVYRKNDGNYVLVSENGESFRADPGVYKIVKEAKQNG